MIETLGQYKILEPAGSGSLGDVYRARDTRVGRTVAITVVADRDRIESGAPRTLPPGRPRGGRRLAPEHRDALRSRRRGRPAVSRVRVRPGADAEDDHRRPAAQSAARRRPGGPDRRGARRRACRRRRARRDHGRRDHRDPERSRENPRFRAGRIFQRRDAVGRNGDARAGRVQPRIAPTSSRSASSCSRC